MRAFVTGATGFVGSALTRVLLAAGHEVRALVRPDSDRANLAGLEVEVRAGDLRAADLAEMVRGCDCVFHVAALYRLWHPRRRTFDEVNIEGTRAVLRAARQACVQRLVHTSSVATLGTRADGAPADEDTAVDLADMIGAYKISKFLGEREVHLAAKDGLDAVIVNPSAPIGPRDRKPTPTGRLVLDAASGRMPAYVDTGLNVVHVDDVARGHLLALERGRSGERYVLGGENLTLREILAAVAALTGQRAPRIRLRPELLLPLAHIAQLWARLRGGDEPRLTVDGLKLARKRMFFRSDKAGRELGYLARPAADALRDAVDWFRDTGRLPADRRAPGGAEGAGDSGQFRSS